MQMYHTAHCGPIRNHRTGVGHLLPVRGLWNRYVLHWLSRGAGQEQPWKGARTEALGSCCILFPFPGLEAQLGVAQSCASNIVGAHPISPITVAVDLPNVGDKCPLTLRRPLVATIPVLAAAEAVLALLQCSMGFLLGLAYSSLSPFAQEENESIDKALSFSSFLPHHIDLALCL